MIIYRLRNFFLSIIISVVVAFGDQQCLEILYLPNCSNC